jgi:putative transposase
MNLKVPKFNGESNHIHAAIEYPPKLLVSQIINKTLPLSAGLKNNHLKGVFSRLYGAARCQ